MTPIQATRSTKPERRHLRSRVAGCLGAALLLVAQAAGAADEPAPQPEPPAKAGQPSAKLAPPGDCAQPRGLPDGAEPTRFDIAGSPAARINPSGVAAGLAPAAPPPPPRVPPTPSPSLCDDPASCSRGAPGFVESQPVPGLPPGAGR